MYGYDTECMVMLQPVEHPHGGGNHQHIGMASTVRRDTSAGRKVSTFVILAPSLCFVSLSFTPLMLCFSLCYTFTCQRDISDDK